nr:MAG TPA: hypothetical protein [Caudoviricetes sp.]
MLYLNLIYEVLIAMVSIGLLLYYVYSFSYSPPIFFIFPIK